MEALGHRSYICWYLASSPADFSSLLSRSICRLIFSTGTPGGGRRLDARDHRPVQYRRLAFRGLAERAHAEALSPVEHLFQPRGWPSLCLSCCRRAPASTLVFGAVTGLLWLATVPPTNGLVAVMFGTRWLSMLSGLCLPQPPDRRFPWRLARRVRVRATGSYDLIWWLSIRLRRDVGAHQSADRREAGGATRAAISLNTRRFDV